MVQGKLDNHIQINKIATLFYTLTKISSKWIRDLNVTPDIVKTLEENIGENLLDISLGNKFLDMTPKA